MSKYMVLEDYAKNIGVTRKTVYNRIESGKIPKENVKKVLNTTLIKIS